MPEYKEQVKIGDFLFELEEKRRTNSRIIELLKLKISKLFSFWFLNYKFPYKEYNHYVSDGGKMVLKKGSRRKIPEIFDNIALSTLTMVKGEKINPSDYEGTVFKHYSIPAYDKYGTYLEEMGETIKSEKYV